METTVRFGHYLQISRRITLREMASVGSSKACRRSVALCRFLVRLRARRTRARFRRSSRGSIGGWRVGKIRGGARTSKKHVNVYGIFMDRRFSLVL